jgi:hypothetical protein
MKQEKPVPYNLRMPAKLKAKLEKQAKAEKRSLNQYLVLTLENIAAGNYPTGDLIRGRAEAVGA